MKITTNSLLLLVSVGLFAMRHLKLPQLAFGAATPLNGHADTIREMKNDVDLMEVEMDALVANMDSIATKSSVVNESLAGKRHKIDKLVRVRRLLKRLEFMFELPSRLSKASGILLHIYRVYMRALFVFHQLPGLHYCPSLRACYDLLLRSGSTRGQLRRIRRLSIIIVSLWGFCRSTAMWRRSEIFEATVGTRWPGSETRCWRG